MNLSFAQVCHEETSQDCRDIEREVCADETQDVCATEYQEVGECCLVSKSLFAPSSCFWSFDLAPGVLILLIVSLSYFVLVFLVP